VSPTTLPQEGTPISNRGSDPTRAEPNAPNRLILESQTKDQYKSANSIRRVPEKDAKKYNNNINNRRVTLSSLSSTQCDDDDNNDDKEEIVGTMEALKALKVPELKDRLRARGLKVGGNKSDLIDRLIMSSPRSNNSLEDMKRITKPPIKTTAKTTMDSIPNGSVLILACKS
jgi:hypothetical protein